MYQFRQIGEFQIAFIPKSDHHTTPCVNAKKEKLRN